MAKIFLDIIPPGEERVKPKLAESKPVSKIAKRNKFLFVFIFVGVVFVFSLCYFFITPKAEIDIWPKMAAVTFQTKATLAGVDLTSEETASQEFSSTGSKDEKSKAEGTITVYNNYKLDQVLIQNTRFWCFEGDKLFEFKTEQKVVIPAGGKLDVKVMASQAGAEYNIPPCTFSIPGLKGSPRYTAVYGKSSSPMTGGAIAKVSQVTDEDLNKAKEVVTQAAFKKSKEAIDNLISSGDYIIAEGGTIQKVIEQGSLAKSGDISEKFSYDVKVQTNSLVIKKADLEKFAKEYVLSQFPEGKEIQESSLKLEYPIPTADLKTGKISLDLKITVNTYSSIDENSLKEKVRGEDLGQIKQRIGNYSEIEKARVRFWPFWATKAPKDKERISIKLMI